MHHHQHHNNTNYQVNGHSRSGAFNQSAISSVYSRAASGGGHVGGGHVKVINKENPFAAGNIKNSALRI